MNYAVCDVPPAHASGANHAELYVYQKANNGPLIIEVPGQADGVDSILKPNTRRFTLKFNSSLASEVWQPRTDRGRRLMALRERVVASGVRLLDLDEINHALAGGRRQDA